MYKECVETELFFILGLAIFFGFFVQTVTGFAAGLIAVSIMTQFIDLQDSIFVVSIFFVFFSCILLPSIWKDIDRKTVYEVAIVEVVGIFIGLYLLRYGNPLMLKKGLGVFILLYLVYTQVLKTKVAMFKGAGPFFGLVGGVFAGLYNAGGPLIVTYIHNKLEKADKLRATIIGTLAVGNFVRLPIFYYFDMYTVERVDLLLQLTPFFVVGLFLGNLSYKRMNKDLFKLFLIVLLTLSAISLIVR